MGRERIFHFVAEERVALRSFSVWASTPDDRAAHVNARAMAFSILSAQPEQFPWAVLEPQTSRSAHLFAYTLFRAGREMNKPKDQRIADTAPQVMRVTDSRRSGSVARGELLSVTVCQHFALTFKSKKQGETACENKPAGPSGTGAGVPSILIAKVTSLCCQTPPVVSPFVAKSAEVPSAPKSRSEKRGRR